MNPSVTPSSDQISSENNILIKEPKRLDEEGLTKEIETFYKDYKPAMDALVKGYQENLQYYFARYMDTNLLPEGQNPVYVPKIFENLETIIPIVTDKMPEPEIKIFPVSKKSKRFAENLKASFSDAWELDRQSGGLEMQRKEEQNFRNLFMQRFMAYKLGYDTKNSMVTAIPIPVEDIIWPLKSLDEDQCPAIMHRCKISLSSLIEMFPKKEKDIYEALGGAVDSESTLAGSSVIEYWEYWKNDFVGYYLHGKAKKVLLGYDANPFYNWPTKGIEKDPTTGYAKRNAQWNHFKTPHKPFIIESDITTGRGLVSESSLLEMMKSSQQHVDKRKMQTDRNADLTNGQVVGAGEQVTKEDFEKLTFNGTKKIWAAGASDARSAIAILTAHPFDPAVINDGLHSEDHMDKVSGATATLRGERTAQETLGGRQILRDSALTRNEPLFRLKDRVTQKLFNWMCQMMCVFYEDDHLIMSLSADSSRKYNISRKDFEQFEKIVIKIIKGSAIPTDKEAEKANAFAEAQSGLRSTLDYHRDIGTKDADAVARRAFLEKSGAGAQIYGMNGDALNYNVMAILHIERIQNGLPVEIFHVPDVDIYKAHVKTHTDYLLGMENDDDLTPFNELDEEVRQLVQTHTLEETKLLEQLVEEQKTLLSQNNMLSQQNEAFQHINASQGTDPQALQSAQDQASQPQTTAAQSILSPQEQASTADINAPA